MKRAATHSSLFGGVPFFRLPASPYHAKQSANVSDRTEQPYQFEPESNSELEGAPEEIRP